MCAKISDMTGEERETHLNITADVRSAGGDWELYTDDPVVMRDLERKGIKEIVERRTKGGGKFYSLPQNQITIRKKRVISEESRAELSRRARENFVRQQGTAGPVEEVRGITDEGY